eukprot:1008418-Amphidinium_carterae.1
MEKFCGGAAQQHTPETRCFNETLIRTVGVKANSPSPLEQEHPASPDSPHAAVLSMRRCQAPPATNTDTPSRLKTTQDRSPEARKH